MYSFHLYFSFSLKFLLVGISLEHKDLSIKTRIKAFV